MNNFKTIEKMFADICESDELIAVIFHITDSVHIEDVVTESIEFVYTGDTKRIN